MSRLPAVLVALLLLAVPVAAVDTAVSAPSTSNATATTAPVSVGPNATNVLRLTDAGAGSFVTTDSAVTTTVGVASAGLDGTFSTDRFDAHWNAAANDTERLAVLRNATAAAANRTNALVNDEAAARSAYVAGRLSAHAFVQRLALDSARAESLFTYLGALRNHANSLGTADASRRRLAELRGRLAAYESDSGGGDLRAQLADAVTGDRAPLRVFVAASNNGITLTALDDGVYYHTTYRVDNYDDQPAGAVDLSAFAKELEQLYPTAWNRSSDSGGRRSYSAPGGSYLYKATLGYTHGSDRQSTLVVYFDPSTHAVYREDEHLYTGAIVGGPLVSRTSENLTLSVNRTYAGGPLRVRAVNATGAPLSVPVSLDGAAAGTTDPKTGTLWLLSPSGNYTVSASRDGTTVSLDTSTVAGS